ncbi:LysE family translocator [Actinokineospora pegani]|uniref:LysE family translocator n=1 Tax=Actinokineospora pegani TaxID=2654637 RepID=UPI0018D4C2F9|nr:LysE family translocator [Actinokineospora pegani]
MSWEFLVVVLAVVVVPGADFIVTLRNTVAGGPGAGAATAVGVGTASLVQATLVSVGLGTLVVRSQPVFTTLKWVGIAYLLFLAAQALRSAWRGRCDPTARPTGPGRGLRQGFLCNITNPKMMVFYLSLLPQFVGPDASVWSWMGHAWALPLIGTAWLLAVVVLGAAVREKLLRPLARRVTDAVSGLALLGFGARLALHRG